MISVILHCVVQVSSLTIGGDSCSLSRGLLDILSVWPHGCLYSAWKVQQAQDQVGLGAHPMKTRGVTLGQVPSSTCPGIGCPEGTPRQEKETNELATLAPSHAPSRANFWRAHPRRQVCTRRSGTCVGLELRPLYSDTPTQNPVLLFSPGRATGRVQPWPLTGKPRSQVIQ